MPSKQELEDQLALTQKLVSAVEQMAKNMEKVENSLDAQISAMEKLAKAMGAVKDQDLSSFNNIKLDKVQKELKKTDQSFSSVSKQMKDFAALATKKVNPAVFSMVGAFAGLTSGLKSIYAVGKSAYNVISTIVGGMWELGASIIAIPLKMFEGLIDIAAQAGGGTDELAQALENLREAMGDLKGPGTSAVITAANSLQGFADTGLSAWRVFGTLAERIEYMTKLATSMGNTFNLVRHEFEQNGGAIAAYQKGLGISEEQMKSFGDRAITMGDTMSHMLLDTTKQTLALGKAFGIDQKLIGKDMAKAVVDVKHFGAVTIKEIGQSAVYAHKLGVELDKIVGVLDQFETFDSAAESAAKLSQSFGVNVDAFKLMEAQNPAESLDMLRKSFRSAGVDASNFTRQQAKLLSMNTGLDEATVRQVFSAKNYGVSLDDIKKKSDAAQKKTLSQADAMAELSASIKRLVMGGGSQLGSFWQQFVAGIMAGIEGSVEFRTIIMNIKQALHITYMEGIRLGQAFVKMFPGVQEFLGGIADFFQPAKFKRMIGGVVDVLKDWMGELQKTGGKASFSTLMENLRSKFFTFFDSQSPAGQKLINGFKTFSSTLLNIFTSAIRWSGEKIAEGIRWIIEIIKDPSKLISGANDVRKGAQGIAWQFISSVALALYDAGKVIIPAVIDLFTTIAIKIYDYVISDKFLNYLKPAAKYIGMYLFGRMFIGAMQAAAISAIGTGVSNLFRGGGIMKQVTDKVDSLSSATKAPKISSALPDTEDAKKSVAASDALAKGGGISWGSVLKFLVGFAGVVAIGMVAVFAAIMAIRKYNISTKELTMAIGSIAALALAMVPAAAALFIIGHTPLDPVSTLFGIAAIGVSIVAMAGVLLATTKIFSYIKISDLKDVTSSLFEMSKVFLMASGIILISAGLGAAISASVGIGAGVIALGFGAIVSAVGIMALSIVGIMKTLDGMNVGPGFSEKIKAFTSVMDSVVNFSKNLTSMLEAVKPSFISLITHGDDTLARVSKLDELLKAFYW
jgi:hypothetical protein